MKRLVITLILAAVGCAGALGLYAWVDNQKSGKDGIKLIAVERGAITDKALAVGQIEPRLEFQVKCKISGIVKRCFAEVGDTVRAGDPLFEIGPDPTPQELLSVDHGLRSAEASFEKANADYERASLLFKEGMIARGELDGRQEAFELARVALDQAQDSRELTRRGKVTGGMTKVETILRAPASGTFLSRSVNPGDPVVPLTSYQPGTELATIADMGKLVFKGTVDEIDVGKIRAGMLCRLKVGALPDAPVAGALSRIAPQARKQEGATLFDVEVELAPGSGAVLRAGYSATADIVIREKTGILVLPERLVLFEKKEDGKDATFVEVPGKGPQEPPEKTAVTLGLSDGLNVEIESGLSEGQKVVQRPPREIS